jgi:hypothetical protein
MIRSLRSRLSAAWQSLVNQPSRVEITHCHIFPRPGEVVMQQLGQHGARVVFRRYVIIPTEGFVQLQSRMTLAGLDAGPAVDPDLGASVEYEIPTVKEQR